MASWHSDDQWKAYAGWLSPQWAEPRSRFDAAAWCDRLVEAGFRTAIIHAKHHDGLCFFPSRFRTNQPPRDYFGELVSEGRKRGMKVVAYYSTLFDSVTAQERPDLCCREADGSITELKWPPFPMGVCCHNNPGYRELLLGQLEEVQAAYDTDGFWMDGFDYTGYPSHACFCRWCRERYASDHDGLRLDDAYLTDELKLWQRDVFLELLAEIRDIALRDGKERVVTYNNAGANLELGYDALDDLCTVNSMEAHSPLTKSAMCRLLASRGKPYEIYTPVSDVVFSWTQRTDDVLQMESGIILAHGGAVLAGLDIAPDGYLPIPQMEQLAGMYRALEPVRAATIDAKSIYDVGLLLPKSQWKNERGGWMPLLLRNHVLFTLLPLETEDFSAWKTVIVSDGFRLTPRQAEALREYVRRGGNVIIERGAALPDDRAFALGDLLGVRQLGDTGFETHYLDVGPMETDLGVALPGEPIRCDGYAWKIATTTAEALASFVYPVAKYSRERWIWREPNPPRADVSDDPAVTLNRFGEGKAVYLPCALPEVHTPQHRRMGAMCAALVRALDPHPLLRSEAPSTVEVVATRQKEGGRRRHVVHFLNHGLYEGARYDATPPTLADVAIWLNEERVGPISKLTRLTDGRELDVHRDGTWVRVGAERLTAHEMIGVE